MVSVHTLDGFQRRQPLPLGQRGQHLLSPAPVAHWPVEVSMGSAFGAAGAWFHIGPMYDSSRPSIHLDRLSFCRTPYAFTSRLRKEMTYRFDCASLVFSW